ncbi:MAG: ribosome silencing factor [Victivallaceae bacterium]|nr:ribosome silencing factor [Victivallaceae bacterium]
MPKKKQEILPVDKEIIDVCRQSIEDKKGVDCIVLSPGAASSVADHFVIAAAESEPQLRAMASAVERAVREKVRRRPLSAPADSVSGWVLLDYGNVLVHLMTTEARAKYDLEGLWGDAPGDAIPRLSERKGNDE